MPHHLGYDKHQLRPVTNARNGYTQKTVIIGDGPLDLRTPHYRDHLSARKIQSLLKEQLGTTFSIRAISEAQNKVTSMLTPLDLSPKSAHGSY